MLKPARSTRVMHPFVLFRNSRRSSQRYMLASSYQSQPAPPGYSPVSLQQVLRADRQAFMLMSERLTTLKKDANGKTPIEKELVSILNHSSVSFHLLPLARGQAPKAAAQPKQANQDQQRQRSRTPTKPAQPNGKGKGKGKGTKSKRGRGPNVPEALIGKALNTKDGKRKCWAFNLPNGCNKSSAGGRLTAALKAVGFADSFGVDVSIPHNLSCPILKLDLLQPDQLELVKELIASPNCAYVHLAPPCGTSSRARLIQRKGRVNPPIARTDRYPNGIPTLKGTLLARVVSANRLYAITCDIIRLCEHLGKLWSCENPGRSFMWVTTPFTALINDLAPREVLFHHCRYGSSRRKLTKLLHNIKHFEELAQLCGNDHEHEAWGQMPSGEWATALEVAYPWPLCRAMATKLALELQSKGATCTPPCFALQEESIQALRASTEIQPRHGIPPMVSEFMEVTTQDADCPLPPNSRPLSTPPRGNFASATHGEGNTITIGVNRSPQQFVNAALQIGHPTWVHSLFPQEMRDVISHCVSTSQQDLARERTAELRRWTLLAEEVKETDNMLLESLSSRRRDILRGKRLCLLERLLGDAGHQDTNLVKDIAAGFDLTGPLPACSELRKIAASCRKAMLSSVSGSGDADLDRGLIDATKKEVTKGYLVGPIDESLMPEGATLTRRLSAESRKDTGLKAKCWDLSDAYKQLPLSDHAFDHDAFLVVFDPDSRRACIYQQKGLPFGSIASVTSFLRLSLALWKLGSSLLNVAWSSYFDDFLSLAEAGMERHTDMVITFLFSTLGWRLATEKLVDFDSVCKVLGVKLNLSEAHLGTATVMNTPERVDELIADIDQILQSGTLTRREGERLRGRLQFASSQLFGRVIRNYLRQLSKHIASGRRTLGDEVTVHHITGLQMAEALSNASQRVRMLENRVAALEAEVVAIRRALGI
eukprot:s1937_g17.t1